MVKGVLQSISLLLILTLTQGCIKEGLKECEEETTVLIKVIDVTTGEDITTSGIVSQAELYIFNQDKQFIHKIDVDTEEITQKIPVIISSVDTPNLTIVSWGNRTEKEVVQNLLPGSKLDEVILQLTSATEDYVYTPDDLFFGIKEINLPVTRSSSPQEIVMERVIARMQITVRGLPTGVSADNYYFEIATIHTGYNFEGIPTGQPGKIKETGIFNNENDLVNPIPFNVIAAHHLLENHTVVRLFRKTEIRNDILIATAEVDINDQPITPLPAQTTHVLIDLRRMIEVYVKTTPWDEQHQWVEW